MGEEFSFFDLKCIPLVSALQQVRRQHRGSFTLSPSPPLSYGQLQPLHPTLGGERPHTPPVVTVLSLQTVIWLWLQHHFYQGIINSECQP